MVTAIVMKWRSEQTIIEMVKDGIETGTEGGREGETEETAEEDQTGMEQVLEAGWATDLAAVWEMVRVWDMGVERDMDQAVTAASDLDLGWESVAMAEMDSERDLEWE